MYLVFRPKNAAVCDALVKKAFIAAETPAFTLILLIGQQIVISLKKKTRKALKTRKSGKLRVEKVWAQLTNPGDQFSHQNGFPC